MPEYLAPGVYIEEVSFRSKSIEGVSTSTAGFVGPTRWGPITGDPELLTSFADFERMYGGLDDLVFDGRQQTNFMAHAVRAFFDEGGKRLYVSRVFNFGQSGYTSNDTTHVPTSSYASTTNEANTALLGSPPESPPNLQLIELVARFPGKAGNLRVSFTLRVGANALVSTTKSDGTKEKSLTRVQDFDLVHVRVPVPKSLPDNTLHWHTLGPGSDGLFVLRRNTTVPQPYWALQDGVSEKKLQDLTDEGTEVRPVTVLVEVEYPTVGVGGLESFRSPVLLGEFGFDPRSASSLTATFTPQPSTRFQFLTIPFSIGLDILDASDKGKVDTLPLDFIRDLLGMHAIDTLLDDKNAQSWRITYLLTGGNDGLLPTGDSYRGDEDETKVHDFINDPLQRAKNGLLAFEGVEDISIVAAPGYSKPYTDQTAQDHVFAIHNEVINHCEKMRYRIAVLDTPPNQLVSEALAFRNKRSSKYAALYYPWVTIADPQSDGRLNLPPSGFVAGIYARNDINRSVSKAPANEVVGSAIDFEQRINKAQQEVLNPNGVNCLRFFSGHGFLVWGARTISDDPEWKYVNLRRYFAYLEHSIDRGTQWVVFENNSQQLWTNVRHTVEDFLFNEWKQGSLIGNKPEEAYFVRCDLTTMTQNDLDNGRLICLIGVAAVRPAEFVIFRIGQWTGTSSNR